MILTDSQKRWLTLLTYVLFIYATLGIVSAPLRFLRAHGVLRLSLLFCFVLCSAGSLWALIKTGTRDTWRYAFLIGVFMTALLIARRVKIPEEQVHFFEYGLVGILFVRALEPKKGTGWRVFLWALLWSTVVGGVDELLQGLIPNRHFDQRDIFLNAVSAALGLALYSIFPLGNRIRSSSIQQKRAFLS